jgi:hypothetical protein
VEDMQFGIEGESDYQDEELWDQNIDNFDDGRR